MASGINVATVYATVLPDTTKFGAAVNAQLAPAAAAASRTISQKFASAGRGLSTFGRSMTRYVSLPIGLAGAASIKLATDFDQSMRNVNSLLGLSQEKFQDMSAAVLRLSTQTPQSADVLAKGLYDIASSGFAGSDALKVLDASATAASAGLSDTATASRAIVATLNAYGDGANKAAENSDILFQGVNVGVQTFDELANSIGTYIGAASQLEAPLEDVVGAQAAMTLTGINASEAATSLNGIFKTLLKPSEELAAVLKDAGFESGQVALEQEGLQGVMELLSAEVGDNKGRWVELFPEIRAARGAMALASDDGKLLDGVMEKMTGSVGAAGKAFAEQSKGPAFQFQLALNKLRRVGIKLGNELIPIITDTIIPAVQDAVKWFKQLSPEAKTLGVQLAGLALVAGPLLRLAGGLTKVTGALIGLGRAAPAVSGAAGAAGGGLAAAAGPLLLGGLAVRDALKVFGGFQEGGNLGAVEAGLGAVAEKLEAIAVIAPGALDGVQAIIGAQADMGDLPSFEAGVSRLETAFAIGEITLTEFTDGARALAEEFNVELSRSFQHFASQLAFVNDEMKGQLLPTMDTATGLADIERTSVIRLANELSRLGGSLRGARKAHLLEALAVGDGAEAVRILRGLIRDLKGDQDAGADAAKNHADKVDFLRHSLAKLPTSVKVDIEADTSSAVASLNAFLARVGNTRASIALGLGGGEHGGYVQGAASGGYVKRHQVIRVGEGNKREAIQPLEDPAGRAAYIDLMGEAIAKHGGGGRSLVGLRIELDTGGGTTLRGVIRSEIDGETRHRGVLARQSR